MLPRLDIEFLKEKGFFKNYKQDKYGTLDIENKLLYVEVNDKQQIKEIIKEIANTDISYVWFFNPSSNSIYVYRNYGEIKWFLFNPKFKRKDYVESKRDKIKKFSPEKFDILFDVRDVVENFYKELWKIRIKMAKSIREIKEDFNKLLVAQKFIDRLIFTYFLAQLNVLKIHVEGRGQFELNKESVRRFFGWLIENLKDSELFSLLSGIFFDVFGKNENEKNYIYFDIGDYRIRIEGPFLDGDIFRETKIENVKERDIRITSGIKDLINLLNNYNWIVGETLPEDEEVISILSPEVLGHVYEKFVISLENLPDLKKIKLGQLNVTREEFRIGRKKIGAYYTPEEITTYICKNTIEPYLLDKFNGKYKSIEELLNSNINEDKRKAIEILKNIKICDNACGSGAFLVKAAEILYNLRKKLGDNTDDYLIKKEIVTNNLYGVDIMEGAVEIAKLRLWLWLISSSDSEIKIQPLPNLEFNIMCGNSLIGYVEISLKWGTTLLDSPERMKKLLNEREMMIKKYKQIHDPKEAVKVKKEIDEISQKIREELNRRFFNEIRAKGVDIKYEDFLELKPFHWGFEFYDVFSLDKKKEERGFDIIVGNPPYINIYNLSEEEKTVYSKLYKFVYKKYDVYILFIERSIQVLNNLGYLSYITSDKWLAEEYAYLLRSYICEEKNVKEIIYFGDYPVFENVGVRNVIFILSKGKKFNNIIIKTNDFHVKCVIEYQTIEKHPRKHIRVELRKEYEEIVNFIILHSIKLGELCYVNWGCRPSPSEKYVFEKYEECLKVTGDKNKCKKLIKGLNIERYGLRDKNKWLAYLKSMYNPMFPELFESDRIIIKDIGIKPLKATFISGDKKLYSDHTTINLILYENLPREKKYSEILNKAKVNLKYLLTLINSRLINFYLIVFLSDGIHVLPENTKQLPIVISEKQKIFIILCDYMLFLNETEERRKSEKNLIEFIDREIIDSLVYDLYFKEKFEEDGLKTNLIGLVEKYLKDIENLRTDEEKLRTIKEVVENMKNDKNLMEEIRKIKNHRWVKIIEDSFNNDNR